MSHHNTTLNSSHDNADQGESQEDRKKTADATEGDEMLLIRGERFEHNNEKDNRAQSSLPPIPANAAETLFPWKLHKMLNEAEEAGFSDVVSWVLDGRAFRVHKPYPFVEKILPRYFKMTKYKSFTRQLHNYGFTWIKKGPEKGGCTYFRRHQFFDTAFIVVAV